MTRGVGTIRTFSRSSAAAAVYPRRGDFRAMPSITIPTPRSFAAPAIPIASAPDACSCCGAPDGQHYACCPVWDDMAIGEASFIIPREFPGEIARQTK
jgi:hypothetical protein